ncbi:PD-(D/E)XK nuclease family protein, partial [bacterium]|nr:PD-(D/E)XK nuclease family protein [bacterium]
RAVLRIQREGRVREDAGERPARFGDILLLARTRTHLAAYEKALRRAGVPIVPAGRGALARSREVQDMLLLLRWLVFRADDTALAGVLRSPLFRTGEAAFQALLAVRLARGGGRGSLWQAMRSDDAPAALAGTAALLGDWLGRVGRESVHRLLRRIYRESRATERFAAALGEQARYNLLRLHDLALAHDRVSFPSLRGFLAEVERAAVREDQEEAVLPDTDQGRVRMMTIHGAKGLEAPFVLLVDHADPMARAPDRVVLPDLHGESGPLVTGLRKAHRDGDAQTAVAVAAGCALQESRREQADLLYVAMTRARDELIVVGAAPSRNKDAPSFAGWLAAGPRGFDETPAWMESDIDYAGPRAGAGETAETPRTWEPCGWLPLLATVTPSRLEAPPLPADAPPDHETDAPLTVPETADGAQDGPEREAAAAREAALAHGVEVHAWLRRAAEENAMPDGSGAAREEARAVFENPAHAWIFRPDDGDALCEAPIIARPGRGGDGPEKRILGAVDRLLSTDDEIVVIDYKSNRVDGGDLDAVVVHYRPQMEAYGEALTAALPGRRVRLVLLFTGLTGDEGRGRCVEIV